MLFRLVKAGLYLLTSSHQNMANMPKIWFIRSSTKFLFQMNSLVQDYQRLLTSYKMKILSKKMMSVCSKQCCFLVNSQRRSEITFMGFAITCRCGKLFNISVFVPHNKFSGKTCIKLIWKLKGKYMRQAMMINFLYLYFFINTALNSCNN